MKKVIKRIINKDLRSINENNLNEKGIYIEFNEENMLQATAMVIGPKDTIYENGILFFDIEFTSQYPFEPPIIKYHSTNNIRIHPNIYVNGKICLSILNTWTGPKWSSIYDISSIFITIQSLLDNNPLENEPGFSGKKTDNHIKYKECVSYENFRTLIIKNIFDIPPQFMCFRDIIVQHYKDKRDHIISGLNKYIYESKFNESTIYIPIYRINLKLTYNLLKELLLKKELELKM